MKFGKQIKNIVLILFFSTVALTPVFVCAQNEPDDQYGFSETYRQTKLATLSISKSTPESLVADIVSVVLFFVGTIFFLLVVYAGLSWMTAKGAPEQIDRAKGILEAAIIGLIIVSASYAISTFIFNKMSTMPEQTEQEVE